MVRTLCILGWTLAALLIAGQTPVRAEEQRFAFDSSTSVAGTAAARIQSAEQASDKPSVQQSVSEAIREASYRTGVEYEYLLTAAYIESGLDPKAKAATSSASGLFQFIETTWLASLKRHGGQLGLVAQTPMIASAYPSQPEPASREALLDLRHDPKIAALIAAAATRENDRALQGVLGRKATRAELYMAHFLGSNGAVRFLRAWRANPGASAARLFPQAARANAPIFYSRGGSARSLDGVRNLIAEKIKRSALRMSSAFEHTAADGKISTNIIVKQIVACTLSQEASGRMTGWREPAMRPAGGLEKQANTAHNASLYGPERGGRQGSVSFSQIPYTQWLVDHISDHGSANVDQVLPGEPAGNLSSTLIHLTQDSPRSPGSLSPSAQLGAPAVASPPERDPSLAMLTAVQHEASTLDADPLHPTLDQVRIPGA